MRIYILTYGRASNQVTWNRIGTALQQHTTLVVQQREAWKYRDFPHIVLPDNVHTLPPTRQFVIDYHDIEAYGDKLVMLDDDLKFATRRTDNPKLFSKSTHDEVEAMFREIEVQLEDYVQVGVMFRQAANNFTEPYKDIARLNAVHGHRVSTMRDNDIRCDRTQVKEDFDITLQLLRKGFKNRVLCNWVWDHGMSGAKGGCSAYRTEEMCADDARLLAELHPGFVKITERVMKGKRFGGGIHVDNIVAWKKAYESSQ